MELREHVPKSKRQTQNVTAIHDGIFFLSAQSHDTNRNGYKISAVISGSLAFFFKRIPKRRKS